MDMSGRQVGDQGRYVVERLLGAGAMGEVFAALDQRLRKRVVLKVLKPEFSSKPNVRERFRNEALIQANLEHPNVVRALDLVDEPDLLAIVMEYVDGNSLEQHLEQTQGPTPLPEVVAILGPVLEAIEYAHNNGVVHRDLKPANILLDQSLGKTTARVADFGIAKLLAQADRGMTREGAVLGTPTYMSPEQLKGVVDLDARTDVYALGIILHQMASSLVPHAEASEYEAVHRVLAGKRLPILAGRVAGVSAAFDEVVARATEPDREQRYASVAMLREELLHAVNGPGSAARSPAALDSSTTPQTPAPAMGPSVADSKAPVADTHDSSNSTPLPFSTPEKPWYRRTWIQASLLGASAMIAAVVYVYLNVAATIVATNGGLEYLNGFGRVESANGSDVEPKVVVSEKTSEHAALRVESPATVKLAPEAKPGGLIDWVSMRGGRFFLGSNHGERDERPVHAVMLDAFSIARTETTVAQYRACVDDGVCDRPASGGKCNWGRGGRDNHAVNCVDWSQARVFCDWAGGRLPTEAEWDYAGRSGGKDRSFPWGDETASCLRVVMDDGGNGCGRNLTWPVCSKPLGNTTQGLCDMAGGVREWCADWYSESYYGRSPVRNPKGPASGQGRILRGGSWCGGPPPYLRTARRGWSEPESQRDRRGFRCAL